MIYKLESTLILLLCSISTLLSQSAFLGVEYEQLSNTKRKALNIKEANGSYITQVLGNSTADKAGLQPMDYVFGLDSKRTNNSTDLGDLLDDYRAGDDVVIHFYRKGRPQTARTSFVPRGDTYSKDKGESAFLGVSPHSNNNGDELGVRVTVVKNSTAQVMGLKNGDVIQSLNGYPIANWVDISLAMSLFEPGDPIAVDLEREGQNKSLKSILLNKREREALSMTTSSEGKKAYLGFYSEKLSRDKVERLGLENPYGIYVTKVIPGSAAQKQGLMPFDYLYGVDEYRVGREQSLTSIFSKYYAEEKATLYLVRRGVNTKLPIVFDHRRDMDNEVYVEECDKAFLGVQQAYQNNRQGVQVNVISGSTAAALGMEDGDILTSINGYPMIDWGDITIAMGMIKAGEEIEVRWLHNDTKERNSMKIKSICESRGGSRSSISGYNNERAYTVMSIEGTNTNLSTLSEEQVEDLNDQFDLDLEEDTDLEVNKFSLIADGNMNEHRIQFSLPERGDTRIRMFNDKGRIVYAYDLGEFVGDFSDDLGLAGNGPGTYFLEISQDGESKVFKIEVTFK